MEALHSMCKSTTGFWLCPWKTHLSVQLDKLMADGDIVLAVDNRALGSHVFLDQQPCLQRPNDYGLQGQKAKKSQWSAMSGAQAFLPLISLISIKWMQRFQADTGCLAELSA